MTTQDINHIEQVVQMALAEDLGHGDATTEALIPPVLQGKASIMAKANGIVAGTEAARNAFLKVDHEMKVTVLTADGYRVKPKDVIARLEGRVSSILKAERVALNLLQHLSGIATETAKYVDAVLGLPVRITDTRKTIPGMRALEKGAVRAGGGHNHRMHLGDGILIKDNHLAALQSQGLSISEILARCKEKAKPGLKIEIEVKNSQEASEAAAAGADIIMLDNMSLDDMRQSVKLIRGRALVEASGGITLDTVRAVAQTGVDLISIGALTHSARALDISLELN